MVLVSFWKSLWIRFFIERLVFVITNLVYHLKVAIGEGSGIASVPYAIGKRDNNLAKNCWVIEVEVHVPSHGVLYERV